MIKLGKNTLILLGGLALIVMTITLYLMIKEHPSISAYEHLNVIFIGFLMLVILIKTGLMQYQQEANHYMLIWISMLSLIFQSLLVAFFVMRLVNTGFLESGIDLYNQISTVILACLSVYLTIRLHVSLLDIRAMAANDKSLGTNKN